MEKTIIEINGVKMEVDLRSARTIDTFKVGDRVKVLLKHSYGNTYDSHCGVIVGFDGFKELPSIVVAYLKMEYNSVEIKVVTLNANTKDLEICLASDDDIPFTKENALGLLQRKREKQLADVQETEWHIQHFTRWFGKYFAEVVTQGESK